ncbi:MAG: class I SAM-dependent methyltransferase [Stackebrandtia sp.]
MWGNEDALFARRAGSFGMHAAAYADHRPDYPADGIRWALAGATRGPRRVVDLGAGTGKLAEGLLALGCEVLAVEPDPGMLAELTRRLPGVSTLDGTAERIPLDGSTVDAVLAGQAFHWFDQQAALTEIARVLRPGGVLGALWNHEDLRVDWVAELVALNRNSVSRTSSAGGEIAAHSAFHPVERETFPHSQLRTADSLTATIGTHSHTLVVSESERAELLDRVRTYLRSRPETAAGEFELPIRTTVLRARLRTSVALEDQA